MGSIPRREFLCAIGFLSKGRWRRTREVQFRPSSGVLKLDACQRIDGRPAVRFEVISVVKKSGHSNDMMEGSGLEKSST